MSRIKSFLSRHKKLVIALAVLAVGAALYNGFVVGPAQAAAAAAQNIEQPTFTLARRELRSGLKVSGNITSAESASVTTSLPYPVAELLVKEGDTVAAGDVIAVLDTTELDSQISAAQKTLARAQAEAQLSVDQAARRLEDARNQKKIDDENPQDLPEANWESVMRQDSLAIEDAQDALNNALLAQQNLSSDELTSLRRQKEQCTITAPQAGVVTSLAAKVGAAATELATIENIGSLEVSVNIKEYDINRVRQGQQAAITSGAGDAFTGEVAWIAPRAAAGSNGETIYPVRLRILDAADTLHLGMTARADIAVETRQNIFVAPLDAVGTDAAGNAVVYACERAADGSAALTPIVVTTGLESDVEVEIDAPELAEGMELLSMAPDPMVMGDSAGMEG